MFNDANPFRKSNPVNDGKKSPCKTIDEMRLPTIDADNLKAFLDKIRTVHVLLSFKETSKYHDMQKKMNTDQSPALLEALAYHKVTADMHVQVTQNINAILGNFPNLSSIFDGTAM